MARIEPTLLSVVTDLERGLRELGVPFGIVGALVPELLLEARPARMTNDADVMVVVQTLSEFDAAARTAAVVRPAQAGRVQRLASAERPRWRAALLRTLSGGRRATLRGRVRRRRRAVRLHVRPFARPRRASAARCVHQPHRQGRPRPLDVPEAHVVGIAAGERARAYVDDDQRVHVFELFRWYRRGTGL